MPTSIHPPLHGVTLHGRDLVPALDPETVSREPGRWWGPAGLLHAPHRPLVTGRAGVAADRADDR